MKTRFISLIMIASAIAFASSCDKEGGENNGPVTPPDGGGEETTFIAQVNEDGSILVGSDNGVDRINSLIKAIDTYADQKDLTVTEVNADGQIVGTDKTVDCSNVFLLERGGEYMIQGKGKISSDVTIKAEDGDGELPVIEPLSDATGAVVADMLVLEASARFENIHFYMRDPVTDIIQERVLRVEAEGATLELNNCFNEYCRNHYIRMEAGDVTVKLINSTFRNFAMGASTNGRVIDARKNAMKQILIDNCLFYNVTGKIFRQDGQPIEDITITNSTFYNCGYGLPIYMPKKMTVENNIFANCGYYTAAFPYGLKEDGTHDLDPVSGLAHNSNYFLDITGCTQIQADQTTILAINDVDPGTINISIKNNNIYNEQWLLDTYAQYKETALKDPIEATSLELGDEEKWLKDNGATINIENTIEEAVSFEKSCGALSDEYLARIMTGDDDGSPITESYYVTGDYSFLYTSGQSLTAATDGGKLGIRW